MDVVATTGHGPEGRQEPVYSISDKLHGFEEAVRKDRRRHVGFAYRRVGVLATAEDIVQNAYLRALESIDNLHGPAEAPYWLWRIVRNCFVDERRSAERWETVSIDEVAAVLPDGPTPEHRCSVRELAQKTLFAYFSTDGRRRATDNFKVFVETQLDGDSYDTIARRYSLNLGTVGWKVHDTRVRLQEIVEGLGGNL